MNATTWILLAWGIANSCCCYWLGKNVGWLKCSDEYTMPALEGWKECHELWGETIAELDRLLDHTQTDFGDPS